MATLFTASQLGVTESAQTAIVDEVATTDTGELVDVAAALGDSEISEGPSNDQQADESLGSAFADLIASADPLATSDSSNPVAANPVAANFGQTDVSAPERIDPADAAPIDVVESSAYTLQEIVAFAQDHDPQVIAAQQQIDVARAQLIAAQTKENPEFVFDVETPIYDRNDPTEISTRLTFPFGTSRARSIRCQTARMAITQAQLTFAAAVERATDEAMLAGIEVAYLQQRLELQQHVEQLAERRIEQTRPELVEGEPGANVVDHVAAQLETQDAIAARFETERALIAAQSRLAIAINFPHAPTVAFDFDQLELDLPTEEEMVQTAIAQSLNLAAANAEVDVRCWDYRLQRAIRVEKEIGPLYQDRLGEDDDFIGARFQTDLPVHDKRQGQIAESAALLKGRRQESQRLRSEIAALARRRHQELTVLAAQISQYREDPFVLTQRTFLADERNQQLLTGQQALRLEIAIAQRLSDELELAYQFARLKHRR